MPKLHGRVKPHQVPGAFHPGSRVRITHRLKEWPFWSHGMDGTVGRVGYIFGPPDHDGDWMVAGLGSGRTTCGPPAWLYPPECLELVDD